MTGEAPHVVIHCNAGGGYGMGHLMRSLAVAQEAERQGWRVSIAGDVDESGVALAGRLAPQVTVVAISRQAQSESLTEAIEQLDPHLIHVDSYWPESDAARVAGVPLSNMQDGSFGVREANLGIDANCGAETWIENPSRTQMHLAGASATVVRDSVRRERDRSTPTNEPKRVLIVLGGTDPHQVTPLVLDALNAIRTRWDLTVISPASIRTDVEAAAISSKHNVTVLDFVDDLPALARQHDAAITAAGTSVWDFACMGVPMGLVCVTENQRRGYEASIAARIGLAVSEFPHESMHSGILTFEELVESTAARVEMAETGRRVVDGLGAWRIVSAWNELSSETDQAPPSQANTYPAVTARRATEADASVLFDWRNDPIARASSRSTAELVWEDHLAWVTRVLDDPRRLLLIAELDGEPAGTVRWDQHTDLDWEVSISVAPGNRGLGLGRAVLDAGEALLRRQRSTVRMLAGIHRDNSASRRLFQRAGYLPHFPEDEAGFHTLAKLIVDSHGPHDS